jgi:hypothetical protein
MKTNRYFSELSALEYFIVRHVAVLSMEPLVEGHFNLEELLRLIDPKKETFWGKFGKAFKNDGRKAGKKKGVFGVSLDVLLERDGAESSLGVGPGTLRIPALIDDAVSAMKQMGKFSPLAKAFHPFALLIPSNRYVCGGRISEEWQHQKAQGVCGNY